MRPPPEVAKLIVDSCSRGNPRMITSVVFSEIIEIQFWLLLDLFLVVSP